MANANENPELEVGFCTDGTTIDIPESLRLLGVTPENPTIHGHVINKLFNMIFENLNHQKKKGVSFWELDEEYEATANNIDICRRNNKIYFCKQSHNDTGTTPKDPATNPDYWCLLLDLDNPIHEALANYALSNHNHDTTYAKLGGLATQTFLVKEGTDAKSAVNKEQMENALLNIEINLSDFDNLKSSNGYQKFPNGLIIQWGEIGALGANTNVIFPIAFPVKVVSIQVTLIRNDNSAPSVRQVKSSTNTYFTINTYTASSDSHFWFAVGY